MPKAIFEENADLKNASLWRRLAAIGYDVMLLIALWFATTMVYMLIKGIIIGSEAMQQIAEAESPTSDLLLSISLLLVTFLFFAYFWQKLGQTLGMQVWRIRVQTLSGKGIDWQQAALRFTGALLSAAALGLGYLWMLWDKDKMTWQDKLSKSRVVYVPPPKKPVKKKNLRRGWSSKKNRQNQ